MKRAAKLILLAALVCLIGCGGNDQALNIGKQKLNVAVGIAPLAEFVEKTGGELVQVVTMVPPGNNPETYSPSAGQMKTLSDASVYFSLELPSEQANILPKLHDLSPGIRVVDLQSEAEKVYPMLHFDNEHHDKNEYTKDFHIWLSPKRAIVIVSAIADVLCEIDKGNENAYKANAKNYIDELSSLDSKIKDLLEERGTKAFIIYHAAYAYFADDYDVAMVAIEAEGKKASATDLQAVIEFAKANGIKTILYQQEFDAGQARTIASEIGGVAKQAAPLSKDYINSMRDFAAAITEN